MGTASSFDARPNEVYMKAQLAKALPQHRILTQEMRIGSVLEAGGSSPIPGTAIEAIPLCVPHIQPTPL